MGWHIPGDGELHFLEEHLSTIMTAQPRAKFAKAIAPTTGWNESTNTGAIGNDQSQSNAYPALV